MKEYANKGRGACPLCKRTGIKAVYTQDFDGKKVNVCKQCKAAVKNGKMKEAIAAL